MKLELLYLVFSVIGIFLINIILRKFKFLVENEGKNNHKKIFATKKKKIQSGGLFFIIILLTLLYDKNIYLILSLILMFILGIFF